MSNLNSYSLEEWRIFLTPWLILHAGAHRWSLFDNPTKIVPKSVAVHGGMQT